MAKILDQARYKCALAAMQTVQSIPGAIPVLHSGPGCASKLNDNNGTSGRFSPNIYPCTSISEKEVVFGGADKLRSTISNALKIIDADLFVVLSGCTGEIIGDDIQEVAEEFEDAEKPVIWAKTPGFKGNNYIGHDWILKSIFEQYVRKFKGEAPKEKGLVNLFAGVPQQDPYWLGNLRELERLLQSIGLKTNTIFGFGRGLENLQKIPTAEYTILVSPWAGLESAQYLEKEPILPIGAAETTKFLRTVAEFTGADKELTESVIQQNEAQFFYYLERYADTILESRIVSKRFTVREQALYRRERSPVRNCRDQVSRERHGSFPAKAVRYGRHAGSIPRRSLARNKHAELRHQNKSRVHHGRFRPPESNPQNGLWRLPAHHRFELGKETRPRTQGPLREHQLSDDRKNRHQLACGRLFRRSLLVGRHLLCSTFHAENLRRI